MSLLVAFLLASWLAAHTASREDKTLVQSKAPFVVSPRFCFNNVGAACERQPVRC